MLVIVFFLLPLIVVCVLLCSVHFQKNRSVQIKEDKKKSEKPIN